MATDYVPLPTKKHWYQNPLIWLAITVPLCAALLLLPRAQSRFHRWDQHRRLTKAAEAYRKGEYSNAMLIARRVLQANPGSRDAKRLVALSLDAVKSPDAASWWRELDRTEGTTSENVLGIAEASLRAGDFTGASMTLARLPAAEQSGARYHELAARIAIARADGATAQPHLREVLRLTPDRHDVRFELARLLIASIDTEARGEATTILEELALRPESQVASLRVLLDDSIRTGARVRANELAQRLIEAPAATFADRLRHLGVLRAGREAAFAAQLATLQKLAESNPEEIAALLGWMIDNDLALDIPEWVSQLPLKVTTVPPVAPAIAESMVRTMEWTRLRTKVEAESWAEMDFLRQAFRARAAEKLGDESNGRIAWDAAVALVQSRPDAAEILGRLALRWEWEARAEEALWKRTANPRCPRWVADFLFAAAHRRGDTASLYRASEVLLKLQPDDLDTRNNHLYLTLLSRPADPTTHTLAAKLRETNPENARVAATFAFSLLVQDRAAEAAKVLEPLPSTALAEPQIARIHAAVLAATGDASRAEEVHRIGASRPLLPEEKCWFEALAAAGAARLQSERGDNTAADASWQTAITAATSQPEPLAVLFRAATAWEWPVRAEQILWLRAARRECPIETLDALRSSALQRGDLAALCKVSRLRRTALPYDLAAQSEFTYFHLLAGEDRETTLRLAESHFRDHAAHPGVLHSFALSRIQIGRAPEAIAALEKLDEAKRQDPRAALCYGLALSDTGRTSEAAKFLSIADRAALLPAERTLLAHAQKAP